MPGVVPSDSLRLRKEMIVRVQRASDAADVFGRASAHLQRLVAFDAVAWTATDPATGIPSTPTHSVNLNVSHDRELCSAYWRCEYLIDDVNLFRDVARASRPAAALRATVGDPNGSRRYQKFIRPLGYDDELRAVLKVGDLPWAVVSLFRERGRDHFSEGDISLMASLSEPLGEALRVRARPVVPNGAAADHSQPAVLLFDHQGALTSTNVQARRWLGELPDDDPLLPSDLGVDVPLWMVALVSRVTDGRTEGPVRHRIRTRHGAWLVCHGSRVADAQGNTAHVAVVIEPAKAADIAPIIVQALDLSPREQQVTSLIARGWSTAEIADALFLSAHTVRDYVKVIFQKVGVSSRGELVATLFAEYYEPIHFSGVDGDGSHPMEKPLGRSVKTR